MNNIMLDKLPDRYLDYRFETSFRVGIQLYQIFGDEELNEWEQIRTAIELLYIDAPSDINVAAEGIKFFLSGWNHDKTKASEETENVMDFDIDQWRIYTAFLQQYHIDLNKADMHWWVFMGLMSNLTECAYTNVVEIRTKKIDPKNMSKEQQKAIKTAKSIYSLGRKHIRTQEEIDATERFQQLLNGEKSQSLEPEP